LVGIEGHSAGGLATAVAAADLQPDATVLFDPVDNGDLGKNAMPKIAAPVLEIFAAPSSCNSSGNWVPFKSASTGAQVFFDVVGSTHCDGENMDRGLLCGFVCGGAATPARQARYSHYATAFFLALLKNDAAAAAELCHAKLAGDSTVSNVFSKGIPGCAAPPDDLGTGQADLSTGAKDLGAAVDFATGSETDASAGRPDGGIDTRPGGGCNCRLSPGPERDRGAWAAVVVALVLALYRRRLTSRRGS
jgi:MYXO-CTERM domain-containing protein